MLPPGAESAHHGDGNCKTLFFPRSNRAQRPPGPLHSILLTFEKDEMSILTLVGCADVSGQTAPEVANWHGVVVQNAVVPDSPEPAALWKREGTDGQLVQGTLARGGSYAYSAPSRVRDDLLDRPRGARQYLESQSSSKEGALG